MAGVGRAVQPSRVKALGSSLWRVVTPRLQRPSRCEGRDKPTDQSTTMTIERPMFPPRAESVDSFPAQPGTRQPETAERTSESRKPFKRLSRHTTDQIGAVA